LSFVFISTSLKNTRITKENTTIVWLNEEERRKEKKTCSVA